MSSLTCVAYELIIAVHWNGVRPLAGGRLRMAWAVCGRSLRVFAAGRRPPGPALAGARLAVCGAAGLQGCGVDTWRLTVSRGNKTTMCPTRQRPRPVWDRFCVIMKPWFQTDLKTGVWLG